MTEVIIKQKLFQTVPMATLYTTYPESHTWLAIHTKPSLNTK